jgi:hypothetical protein
MLPTNFTNANVIFKKPEGWEDEACGDLPVFKGLDADNNPVIISKWQPSTATGIFIYRKPF